MKKQDQREDPLEAARRQRQQQESGLPPDADVEERFNKFWEKNGIGIFIAIALGAIIVLGYQISTYVGEQREAGVREAYMAASSSVEQISFAEEYAKHPLAGVTWMELAEAVYTEEDFGQALAYYQRAVDVLQGNPLGDRARLGVAMSQLMLGQTEDARLGLEILAEDRMALDVTRAEAAYHLAVVYWEAGNSEGMREALDRIFELGDASMWAFRAQMLQHRVPAL